MPKRARPPSTKPIKRRKIGPSAKEVTKAGVPRKNKNGRSTAKDTIPIPVNDDEDVELSDQDFALLEDYGDAVSFLQRLDRKGIARSKQETENIHRLNKPSIRPAPVKDVPTVASDSEGSDDSEFASRPESSNPASDSEDEEVETLYERTSSKRRSPERSSKRLVERLPIKLTDGQLLKTGVKDLPNSLDTTDDEVEEPKEHQEAAPFRVEDVSTGARFGRRAVLDIVNQTSRKQRIEDAKEQIASICQEIVSDPENGLGLLKRLHTFSKRELTSPNYPKPIVNDPIIRKLAILSQLAVFKDIIPGYSIRKLTEKEAAEKVSQVVAHLREWEQGLVNVYQNYLQCLETELKARTVLAVTALKCICTLLTEVTHFNFRVNLIACVVGQLSKRSWTKASDMCLETLNSVLRADTTGAPSLEIVRILHRMIREKRFQIHPNVLSCLLNLRLKSELNVRASETKADKASSTLSKARTKRRKTDHPHLSKKERKVLKERKEIEKELREAEAIVDKEERATTQTETLKLLFTLYFRVLKASTPTPLLPAALHGIAKFAHLVNVDFFKDLMAVLKNIMSSDSHGSDEGSDRQHVINEFYLHLLCIVTAFELLSGQGEALNVDLDDFIIRLYALILPLSLMPDIDHPCSSSTYPSHRGPTIAGLLFDALGFVFSPRASGVTAPPWRSAAFSKRLLTACLNWSPASALRVLRLVGGLISKEPKLEALLSTEDRVHDGVYLPEIDDPQLCHPFGTCLWELQALKNHWDSQVREAAGELIRMTRL